MTVPSVPVGARVPTITPHGHLVLVPADDAPALPAV